MGVNRVDPKQYDGQWDGFLPCCEKDAQDVDNLLKSAGYDKRTLLKTSKATRANVLKVIKGASKSLKKGDLFVIYYSGHGDRLQISTEMKKMQMMRHGACMTAS